MKTALLIIALAWPAFSSPAPVILSISQSGSGTCQIVAPGNSYMPAARPLYCVLECSSDLTHWAAVSTTMFPQYGTGYGVTNIINTTNAAMFYRAYTYSSP
jgi:hypothetical protein